MRIVVSMKMQTEMWLSKKIVLSLKIQMITTKLNG